MIPWKTNNQNKEFMQPMGMFDRPKKQESGIVCCCVDLLRGKHKPSEEIKKPKNLKIGGKINESF